MPDEIETQEPEVSEQQLPIDSTPVAVETDNSQQQEASNNNVNIEDVAKQFESEGLLSGLSTDKKPLPNVEYPTDKKVANGNENKKPAAPQPKPAAAPQDKSKVENKSETQESVLDQVRRMKQGETKPTGKPENRPPGRPGRNYDEDLPKELHAVAKEMSSPAYTEFVKLHKENKALKESSVVKSESGVPVSYFEHPDSYLLSPEFAQTSQNINLAGAVLAHWEVQKQRIANGEDWQDLEVDAKDNIVKGRMLPANDEAKFQVGQYIAHANSQRNQLMQQATQIQQTFKSRAESTAKWLADQEDKHLPMFKDKSYEGWKVADEVFKALPAELRHSPLARTVAKLTAANREATGYLKYLMEEKAKLEAQLAEYGGQSPATATAPNNGAIKGKSTSGGNNGLKLKQGDVSTKDVLDQFAGAGLL